MGAARPGRGFALIDPMGHDSATVSIVTLGALLLACGGPASARADCEYGIDPDGKAAVWSPVASTSAYENWKLAQAVADPVPVRPLERPPTVPEARDAVAGRVRIDTLGFGPDKHYVITFTWSTAAPPVLVLRGAKAGDRYVGEIRVGDVVRFQGYFRTDGGFVMSRSTDLQLLQIELSRAQMGLLLREVTKVAAGGAGAAAGSVAGSQGLHGGVSVRVPIAMPEYGDATMPLRIDVLGGPDVLPSDLPGKGIQVTAVPSIHFSVGMDF